MSSSIWTQCAGASELRPLRLSPWRVVEAQHQVSTRKLVDTAEEQALLEELIDGAKPPAHTPPRLHYLLSTPFRYPPLRHGSRFGGRHERGVWYGSEDRATAFAEVAYYRLLFLEGTAAELGPVVTQLTAFTVRVRTERGIDLTLPPFDAHAAVLTAPSDYRETQALGSAMREAGVEVFRYESARARTPVPGVNTGVFTPSAFGGARPRSLETWHCTATRERVELLKRDYFAARAHVYARADYLVSGRLPAPAV